MGHTSAATLAITHRPDLGARGRVLTIDCPHGVTMLAVAEGEDTGAVRISDELIARLTVARHYDAERCACTERLRRRYGVTR